MAAESGKNFRVMSGGLAPENMIPNFATDQHAFPGIKDQSNLI
jgi:hypothetical protein